MARIIFNTRKTLQYIVYKYIMNILLNIPLRGIVCKMNGGI